MQDQLGAQLTGAGRLLARAGLQAGLQLRQTIILPCFASSGCVCWAPTHTSTAQLLGFVQLFGEHHSERCMNPKSQVGAYSSKTQGVYTSLRKRVWRTCRSARYASSSRCRSSSARCLSDSASSRSCGRRRRRRAVHGKGWCWRHSAVARVMGGLAFAVFYHPQYITVRMVCIVSCSVIPSGY